MPYKDKTIPSSPGTLAQVYHGGGGELGDLLKLSWNDVGGMFTVTPTSSHPAWGKAGGAVGCSAPDTQESKDPANGSEHTSLPRRVVLFPYRDALGRGARRGHATPANTRRGGMPASSP